PRLRAGGDYKATLEQLEAAQFQSTPPRRRRPMSITAAQIDRVLQATPPRRRRRPNQRRPADAQQGSIHASAQEATTLRIAELMLGPVSIHASAQEATRPEWRFSCRRRCFTPRLRAGGDAVGSSVTAGAAAFQSTPPRRRRQARATFHGAIDAFQS